MAETDFTVGELVHWESAPKGKRIIRTGNIVHIVEPNVSTLDAVSEWRSIKPRGFIENYCKYNSKGSRKLGEKGYLVLVIPKDPSRPPMLYCPEPSRLTREWIKAKRVRYQTASGVICYATK